MDLALNQLFIPAISDLEGTPQSKHKGAVGFFVAQRIFNELGERRKVREVVEYMAIIGFDEMLFPRILEQISESVARLGDTVADADHVAHPAGVEVLELETAAVVFGDHSVFGVTLAETAPNAEVVRKFLVEVGAPAGVCALFAVFIVGIRPGTADPAVETQIPLVTVGFEVEVGFQNTEPVMEDIVPRVVSVRNAVPVDVKFAR